MSERSDRVAAIRAFVLRWWFYPALAAAFLIGWHYPAIGQWMKDHTVTPWLVAIAFFLNGLSLSSASLLRNLRRWRLLLVAMVLIFVVPPALVAGARAILPGGDTPLALGYQLLAAMPPTLVSAVALTRVAMGNGAIALYITLFANLLGIVLLPYLLLFTLGRQDIEVNIAETSLTLALTVLLPTLLGQLARRWWHGWIDRHPRLIATLSQTVILAFFLVAIPDLPRGVGATIWATVLLAGLALHGVMLGMGEVAGRLAREDVCTRRAVTLGTAQKTLVLAVFLWDRVLAPLGPAFGIAVLPLITFYLIELVIDSVLAQWWANRHLRAPEPPECT